MKNRIDPKEVKYLQNYLCPSLTEEERKKIEFMREEQRKSMISLNETLKDNVTPILDGKLTHYNFFNDIVNLDTNLKSF